MPKKEPVLIKDKVKEARLSMGLTVYQFAEAIGVGKSTVYRWERGEAGLQYSHAIAVSEFVDDGNSAQYYMRDN